MKSNNKVKKIFISIFILLCLFLFACSKKETNINVNDEMKNESSNSLKEQIKNIKTVAELKGSFNPNNADKVHFGKYDWFVVKKDKNRALLLMNEVLCNMEKGKGGNRDWWEYSEVSKYLETNFYDEFTEDERKMIIPVLINNPNGWFYDDYIAINQNTTTNNVFILSPYEINKYFTKNQETIIPKKSVANALSLAYKDGVEKIMLRMGANYVMNKKGEIEKLDKKSYNDLFGVVPAIVIKYDNQELEKDIYSEEDEKLDIKHFVYMFEDKIKEELSNTNFYDENNKSFKIDNKMINKIVKSFHYMGKPSDYYDYWFVYYDTKDYGIEEAEHKEEYYRHDYLTSCEIRTLTSKVMGDVDIYIDIKEKEIKDIQFNTQSQDFNDYVTGKKEFDEEEKIEKRVDVNLSIKVGDKILLGKYEDVDLIWTVLDINGEEATIYSDYTFDLGMTTKENFLMYNEKMSSFFTSKDEDIMVDNPKYSCRYFLPDCELVNKVIDTSEKRKSLGCLTNENKGEKSYLFGGEGIYKKSVNACDGDGNIYPAYDEGKLPNRVALIINAKNVKPIDDINKVKKYIYEDNYDYVLDTNGGMGDFREFDYLEKKYESKKISKFINELVYKNDDVLYVDYNGKEKNIKNFDGLINTDYKNLRIGDLYYIGDLSYFYKDDIELSEIDKRMIFKVSDIKEGKAIMESLFGLSIFDWKKEDSDGYENSKLKKWLNEEFYNNVFNSEEKNNILKEKVEYAKSAGINNVQISNEKVWVISEDDIFNDYYHFNENRVNHLCKNIKDEWTYINEEKEYPKKQYLFTMYKYFSVVKDDYFTSYDDDEELLFVPKICVKVANQSGTIDGDVFIEDLSLLEYEDKMTYVDKDLYYIRRDGRLCCIKNYDGENVIKENEVILYGNRVKKFFKHNNYILYLDNYKPIYASDYADLYVCEGKKSKLIDESVFPLLIFDDNKIEYYLNAKIDTEFDSDIQQNINKINGDKKTYYLAESKEESMSDNADEKRTLAIPESVHKLDFKPIKFDEETRLIFESFGNENEKLDLKFEKRENMFYMIENGHETELFEVRKNFNHLDYNIYDKDNDAYYLYVGTGVTNHTYYMYYVYKKDNKIYFDRIDETKGSFTTYELVDGKLYHRKQLEICLDCDYVDVHVAYKNNKPIELHHGNFAISYFYNTANDVLYYISNSHSLMAIDSKNKKYTIDTKLGDYRDIHYTYQGIVYVKSKVEGDKTINKTYYYDMNEVKEICEGYLDIFNGEKSYNKSGYNYFVITTPTLKHFKELVEFPEEIVQAKEKNAILNSKQEKDLLSIYKKIDLVPYGHKIRRLYMIHDKKCSMVDDNVAGFSNKDLGNVVYYQKCLFNRVNIREAYENVSFDIEEGDDLLFSIYKYVNEKQIGETYKFDGNNKEKIEYEKSLVVSDTYEDRPPFYHYVYPDENGVLK